MVVERSGTPSTGKKAKNEAPGKEAAICTDCRAVAAAEQGLRTLSSHPSVPRDVAVTADLTLADIRRLVERDKELDD